MLLLVSQAEFYSWSIFGVGLNETLLGRAPSTDGGQKATLTAVTQNYYTEVANDEINHVSVTTPASLPEPTVQQALCGCMHASLVS